MLKLFVKTENKSCFKVQNTYIIFNKNYFRQYYLWN